MIHNLKKLNIFNKIIKNRRYYNDFNREKDTIYALSTAEGRAGIAIIRISGNKALNCLLNITNNKNIPFPRKAVRRNIIFPHNKDIIDQSITIYFPKPKSFTGEDVVELHVHGSRPVISAILDTLYSFKNCRIAEPGEFTERALLNNRMNLLQVEGLADLLNAETETQRNIAVQQMSGTFDKIYENWKKELIKSLAHLEAFIDFGDDTIGIDQETFNNIIKKVEYLIKDIQMYLNDRKRGEIIRDGLNVTILGKPNVGKSSLLNLIAKRQVAIVSPLKGTTRDIINIQYQTKSGQKLQIYDTAGIHHETDNLIELEGISRAKMCAEDSDIKLLMIDLQEESNDVDVNLLSLLDEHSIVVLNKNDTIGKDLIIKKINKIKNKILEMSKKNDQIKLNNIILCDISCKDNKNITTLLDNIETKIKQIFQQSNQKTNQTIITRSRHRHHLETCVNHLKNFLNDSYQPELAAEDLRQSIRSLSQILGQIDVEEILDNLFKDFCIGK